MEKGAVPHAQDGGAAADIKDDLVLEEVAVLVDGVAVALGAHFVFLHAREVSNVFLPRGNPRGAGSTRTSISSWIPLDAHSG